MLELKKITKTYEVADFKQKALNKVDVKFRKNEFVSILGQSGSGKTTMLNIIGGLDKYTSGDLVINGVSTKEYTDRDWDTYRNHNVGFVFQSYNLIPHQTALQNVELALTLSGIEPKERRRRSIAVLKKVGLEKHMYKKPSQMSGGQMQRIAIARALVNDPDILLADEPTGALDSETSLQVLDLLKEIAKDKLVIMVTHNPELAVNYSTRIVKLLDGEIVDDTNPFDGVEEKDETKPTKNKKTSMSFKTALSLSLNNLMTKKGRTILTAFAGSIGIIGIALILSLSNGIQSYIDRVEEETLSSYPLTLQKESIDMSSLINAMSSSTSIEEHSDDEIHSINIMGDMFTSLSQQTQKNDLKSFKHYIENDGKKINDYISSIDYGYNIQMNLYKENRDEKPLQVNPTKVFDAVGMGTDGISSVYSGYMSNYNVFYEMLDNDELNKQQYDLVEGSWPTKYNEMVLLVDENNNVTDYTLYSLGLLSQDDLKEKFNNMTSGKEVEFDKATFKTKDIVGLEFKLLLNTDYYKKTNGVWINMKNDSDYIKKKVSEAETVKIVGIIKPGEGAVATSNAYGMVGYKPELMEHIINKTNEQEIVKKQLENKEVNVFTGRKFDEENKGEMDMSSFTPEQLKQFQKLSLEEQQKIYQAYTENQNVTYEQNLKTLGIADIDDPDTINIYPKDFESKEEIEQIIADYNEGKSEEEKLTYTDIVGIMMSSVSTIVDVISSVLIAFVAISLIVSSIMIAIITYISVIERTKEIGILRAIGASKKDISRVFNAETFIEGLAAGVLGIVVTLILNIPINIIIEGIVDIKNISILPIDGAIILIIISMVLTVVAGFIPAKIASKKDPVEALRTE